LRQVQTALNPLFFLLAVALLLVMAAAVAAGMTVLPANHIRGTAVQVAVQVLLVVRGARVSQDKGLLVAAVLRRAGVALVLPVLPQ
jgi:hypothetical protein